jgi:hypothetical protein
MESLDRPDIADEIRAAFDAYERALLVNDIVAMNGWFWNDERVIRFGLAEEQYGFESVAAWRATAPPVPANRQVTRVRVQVFGDDVASVDCEFRNGDDASAGRQSQMWIRTDAGWRIARAHVSMNGT